MSRKKRKIPLPERECIALVAVHCPLSELERKERLQENYIRSYAKNHNINIVKVVRTNGMSQSIVNDIFNRIVLNINDNKVEGIIIANTSCISNGLKDAYCKVGAVVAVGGEFISVDEPGLRLNLREEMYGL